MAGGNVEESEPGEPERLWPCTLSRDRFVATLLRNGIIVTVYAVALGGRCKATISLTGSPQNG